MPSVGRQTSYLSRNNPTVIGRQALCGGNAGGESYSTLGHSANVMQLHTGGVWSFAYKPAVEGLRAPYLPPSPLPATMSATPPHDSDSKLGDEPRPVLSTQTADSAARRYVVPDGVDEKKLMRKVDFRIIPWLSVLYLISFLDRSAIGNARLYGLEEDLEILGTNKFNIASAIFFFPYAVFEIPSNIMLKRLRPSVWFPLITCLVGICMMSQGLVSSYGGLLVARFFLGVTEAGLFPGANYLLSGWYKRSEFGLRASIFFSAATVSGAFGGECDQHAPS